MVAEAAFWKGSSKVHHLFDLVLQLKSQEGKYGLTLHVTHVSGKRMKQQGTNELSRSDMFEGVLGE